jgi:ubiquinone/menaquinone biosynthesis C-methylase UbiE
MNRETLDEQIAFYRARAPEYDQSWETLQELQLVKQVLRSMGPFAEAVELAPGRGLWTRELVQICGSITAIDASPEMIALNRQSVASDRVTYQVHDLFRWEPDKEYDLLFAGFWLSHVPPDTMDAFLTKVGRAVRRSGTVMFVDQCNDIPDDPQGENEGILQRRRVANGRTFTIIKVYYHPGLLGAALEQFGFDVEARRVADSFFSIVGRKR